MMIDVCCARRNQKLSNISFHLKYIKNSRYSCFKRWNISICLSNKPKTCIFSWCSTPLEILTSDLDPYVLYCIMPYLGCPKLTVDFYFVGYYLAVDFLTYGLSV